MWKTVKNFLEKRKEKKERAEIFKRMLVVNNKENKKELFNYTFIVNK